MLAFLGQGINRHVRDEKYSVRLNLGR
jgi:hypothetical protein